MKNASTMTFPMDGSCNPGSVVQGKCYRFTLITERILRMEYDPEGIFEDRPSQTVLHRNFPTPEFTVKEKNGRLEIDTRHYHLNYQVEQPFTDTSLVIDIKNGFTHYGGCWRFGQTTYGDPPRHENLMGTARTLDKSVGEVPLERGLMDKGGRSFFDDSETALLEADGSLSSRREDTVDVYYVCCQHDYADTLADFYRISGAPPMLPRYALGNWWSRWWKYTEDSYNTLMDEYRQLDIPFTVGVLDMDWHLTKVDPKYGPGWTGFTWDRELFPEPERFLQGLHERGLHTALNLHPADGVQGFEDAYAPMAEAMGVDAEKEEPVLFDFTDPKFIDAYFTHLLHPHEDMGVDFWWIDWQQGRKSARKGLDPLWLLNHYHYLDNCRDGKRGLILSRYAGLGAQRYPAGFSGDTTINWDCLDFQARFTATAINAGFPWWSHDIGGFMNGIREPEIFIRWVQLGAFSAFMRLHSSRRLFVNKDPRTFGKAALPVISHWLRLRHRMIPYVYSEVYRQHKELKSLIRPMYYAYPEHTRAYEMKNQFCFGSELVVCPITAPADQVTGMGSVKAWIPKGIHTDIFTGKTYAGERVAVLNRSLEAYPVLGKPGAIVPLAVMEAGSNSVENPAVLEVIVCPGANNTYTMFEDDGSTDAYKTGSFFETEFCLDWENRSFMVSGRGDTAVVPQKREYCITFRGFDPFTPQGDGIRKVSYDGQTRSVIVELEAVSPEQKLCICMNGAQRESGKDRVERCLEQLMGARIPTTQKVAIQAMLMDGRDSILALEEMVSDGVDSRVISCLAEILIN